MRDTTKYQRRQSKIDKRKYGMRIDGRSVLLLEELVTKPKKKRKKKR